MTRELDNWYPCEIRMDGFAYPSAENAFQATRFADPDMKYRFQFMPVPRAYYNGSRFRTTVKGWESSRYDAMYAVLRIKFSDPGLRRALLDTEGEIVVTNTRHDNEWGRCLCARCAGKKGRNGLGKLLMQLRGELRMQLDNAAAGAESVPVFD